MKHKKINKTPTPSIITAAELYQQGENFFQKKQISEALKSFLLAANLGEPKAQFRVAQYYYSHFKRIGTSEDLALIITHNLRGAVKKNEPNALILWGDLHRLGECGIAQNTQQAISYYQAAAEQKHPGALYKLALCQLDCRETTTIGLSNLKKAASLGEPEAISLLEQVQESSLLKAIQEETKHSADDEQKQISLVPSLKEAYNHLIYQNKKELKGAGTSIALQSKVTPIKVILNPYHLSAELNDILNINLKIQPIVSIAEEKILKKGKHKESKEDFGAMNPLLVFAKAMIAMREWPDNFKKNFIEPLKELAISEMHVPLNIDAIISPLKIKLESYSIAEDFFNDCHAALDYIAKEDYPSSLKKIFLAALVNIEEHITKLSQQDNGKLLRQFKQTKQICEEKKSHTKESSSNLESFIKETRKLITDYWCVVNNNKSKVRNHPSIIFLTDYLNMLNDKWIVNGKESITQDIIYHVKEIVFYYSSLSLHLQYCLKDIADWSIYCDFQRSILNQVTTGISFLQKLGLQEVDYQIYYSIDCHAFIAATKNVVDDFGNFLDFNLSALKSKNTALLESLEIKNHTAFEFRKELFSRVRLIFNATQPIHFQEIDSLIAIARQNNCDFFAAPLLVAYCYQWLNNVLYRGQYVKPEVTLTADIPELLTFFQKNNFNENFFRTLAQAWWNEQQKDPLLASLNLYSSVTQLALLTQVILRYMINEINALTEFSPNIVEYVYRNFFSLTELQRDILSFFSFRDHPKHTLNSWCFFNKNNHAIIWNLPILYKNNTETMNALLFINLNEINKTIGIPFKSIQATTIAIEKDLIAFRKTLAEQAPKIALTEILDIICRHNIKLTTDLCGKSQDFESFYTITSEETLEVDPLHSFNDTEIAEMKLSYQQCIQAIDDSIRIAKAEKQKLHDAKTSDDLKQSNQAYQQLQSKASSSTSHTPTPAPQQKKKAKKKKKKLAKLTETNHTKPSLAQSHIKLSSITLEQKEFKSTDAKAESAINRLFIKVRELTRQLGQDANLHRYIYEYKLLIEKYTSAPYDEGVQVIAFLTLRDLYAFMALRYLKRNLLDEADIALNQALLYYEKTCSLKEFISNDLYKDYRELLIQSTQELQHELAAKIKKLEDRLSELELRKSSIQEHLGLDWWHTQLKTKGCLDITLEFSAETRENNAIRKLLYSLRKIHNSWQNVDKQIDPFFNANNNTGATSRLMATPATSLIPSSYAREKSTPKLDNKYSSRPSSPSLSSSSLTLMPASTPKSTPKGIINNENKKNAGLR